jgi:hypothetical protein
MATIERFAQEMKCSVELAFEKLEKMRERCLDRILEDPYRYGLEPSIWWVADALVDFPTCTVDTAAIIKAWTGLDWDGWKVAVRKLLGFARAVKSLLSSGANRSGKTERASKRNVMLAVHIPNAHVWALHETWTDSAEKQQDVVRKYMPVELKINVQTEHEYIKYKDKTGFAGRSFILPNGTRFKFAVYSQDVKSVMEGTRVTRANPDENFGVEWLLALERRAAQLNGIVECTFTPVHGWTAGVGEYYEGMTPVKTMPAYMLPRDGKPGIPWAAMGLSEAEYRELERAEDERREAVIQHSRPQDCTQWLKGAEGLPPPPAGRIFDVVPRVAKCRNPDRAIVWFHPCDNPYGNPRMVIRKALNQGTEMVQRSVYGMATRKWSAKFPGYRDWVGEQGGQWAVGSRQ